MKRASPVLAILCAAHAVLAQPAPEDPGGSAAADPAHQELRALKAGVVDAIGRRDLDALLGFLAPDVVVTWQDGTISRGRDGVKAYYERMMKGAAAVVRDFHTEVTVDALTILYGGGTGISYGSSVDSFDLAGGLTFRLDSRWSAALVKLDGRWLIASFHASTNLFDNPLLNNAKRWLWGAAAGAGLLGLAVGLLLGRRRK